MVTIPAYLENMVMLTTVTEDIALTGQRVMEDQVVVTVFQELLQMAKNSDLWSQIIQKDMLPHIRIFKRKR
ncbi:hypothetical protein HZU73_04884 [Apis mellifera caucasica]|nr:hypothetical protein HZU73_04884 [Apis mellifera caucasica]KAG9428818.1 hypothetical protein HZU67_09191 [Apis mellifera carnica]